MIPEYNKGWGAGCVHKESQMIGDKLLNKAIEAEENIVYPRVGGEYAKLSKEIHSAKQKGYRVFVHMDDLDRNRALGRMIERFVRSGRFLNPVIIDKYVNYEDGNKIEKTYERLKKAGEFQRPRSRKTKKVLSYPPRVLSEMIVSIFPACDVDTDFPFFP